MLDTLFSSVFALAAANAVGIVLTWLAYLITRNNSIIDLYWSSGICLMGVIFFLGSGDRSLFAPVSALVLFFWCARLAGFLLLTRILKGHTDPRSDEVMSHSQQGLPLKYPLNFIMQGALQCCVALTLWRLFGGVAAFAALFWAGVALSVPGIIGSHGADMQLYRFKQNRGNKGKVRAQGLWRYSRHPNYFFEFVLWRGFALQAVAQGVSVLLAIAAPATMLVIFLGIIIRITDRHSRKSKGAAFERYAQQTSAFIPLPPKN